MRARMVLSALLKLRNIGVLVAVFTLLSLLGSPSALPALIGIAWPAGLTLAGSLAVYIVFVIQTLFKQEISERVQPEGKVQEDPRTEPTG